MAYSPSSHISFLRVYTSTSKCLQLVSISSVFGKFTHDRLNQCGGLVIARLYRVGKWLRAANDIVLSKVSVISNFNNSRKTTRSKLALRNNLTSILVACFANIEGSECHTYSKKERLESEVFTRAYSMEQKQE